MRAQLLALLREGETAIRGYACFACPACFAMFRFTGSCRHAQEPNLAAVLQVLMQH